IIASDQNNGLFVLGANYVYGCYLEGIVTDSLTGDSLNNVLVEIISTTETALSDANGLYSAGIADSGAYDIQFSKPGYFSKIISGVSLTNGVVTVLNAQLKSMASFTVTGQVIEFGTGNPIPNAGVLIENNDFQYNITTDSSGNFTIPNFFQGNYEATAGKWGYYTNCVSNQLINISNNTILIKLGKGIYDDFTYNFSWTVTGTAATGIWERGKPVGTDWIGTGDANPGVDVSQDCSDFAYVTGNGGGNVGFDDVDDGNTVLTSPLFDVSSYTDPYINYYRWFFNDGGGFPNDTLHVKITNGTTTVTIESVDASSAGNSSWVFRSFKVSDYITPTATMQVIFETSDLPGSGHLVEAGVDKFQITDFGIPPVFDFTASATSICTSDTVQFSDYSMGATSYLWFFGDGGSATVMSPSHVYTIGDTSFIITLIASNLFCSDTTKRTIIITSPLGIAPGSKYSFELGQNYPNPANKETSIRYSLTKTSDVTFILSNIIGKEVKKYTFSNIPAGEHQLVIIDLHPGIYFYSMRVEGNVITKKMIITQ
ncbi:MAG: carboxypeptidase regulatory-like domain-containing protein, partial [Bacteroidetes bacterium]|nr:carboxypeptidase regulatory-like domain-containing protein [Bacteroidota bacterium]